MYDQSMVHAQGKCEPMENAGAAAEADAEDLRAAAAGRWPFQRLCGQLLLDVLHAQWEVRSTPRHVCFVTDPPCKRILKCQLSYSASCTNVVGTSIYQSHCSLACAQVRHGAALALREVMRSHAAAAAVVAPLAAEPTGVPRA